MRNVVAAATLCSCAIATTSSQFRSLRPTGTIVHGQLQAGSLGLGIMFIDYGTEHYVKTARAECSNSILRRVLAKKAHRIPALDIAASVAQEVLFLVVADLFVDAFGDDKEDVDPHGKSAAKNGE
eukprot:1992223-Pleurochrysis_carterae.AAC.2